MKLSALVLRTLLAYCFLIFLTVPAFAQDVPISQPLFGKGLGSGMADYQPFLPRKARCAACAFLTDQYNDARDDLMDQGDYLDELDADLSALDAELDQLETEIKDLKRRFIKNPTSAYSTELFVLQFRHKVLSRDFGRGESTFSKEERRYNQMASHLETIEQNLNECEAKFCKLSMANPVTQLMYMQYFYSVQLGLMLGNMTNSQTGYIYAPGERFSGSNTQNNSMFGPQARFMFGQAQVLHAFLLLNAVSMFNQTNSLLRVRTDSFSSNDSRLRIINAWVAHMLIGLQAPLFFNNFSVSGGVGAGLLNQELKTSIAEDVITNKNTSQTSVIPSVMLSVDYKLCRSCISGHDVNLSGQLSADRYPGVDSTVTTPLGNTYRSKTSPDWSYSEALVLSMDF